VRNNDDQRYLEQARRARIEEQLQALKLLAAELEQRPHDLTLRRRPQLDKLTLAIHYLQQAVDAFETESDPR
jgi:hypothetical protein